MPTRHDIAIVGAGIIGLAVADRLLAERPGTRVVVLEKEDAPARHQTGRNSGVVHAGIYYPAGSLKARLVREGVPQLRELCAEHGIPYDEIGKVVIALDESEVPKLDDLQDRSIANRVPGLARLDGAGLRALEPEVAGVAALHSPHTAITDFVGVAAALAERVTAAGGEVRLGVRVTDLRDTPDGVDITVAGAAAPIHATTAVIAAGLHADRLAVRVGGDPDPRIVPFRGEYYRLAERSAGLVRGLIYPVPDPRYPFLGVHFTPTVTGEVLVGPNAVLALAREGYRWRTIRPGDLWNTITWPGFLRLARRHWRTGIREVRGSLSRRAYAAEARRYLPALERADLERSGAGVRAQAVDRSGNLVDDFRIEHSGNVVSIRNAPSPAATASLAIAGEIVSTLP